MKTQLTRPKHDLHDKNATKVTKAHLTLEKRKLGKRRAKFVFEIRQRLCGLCHIGKIVPEHCTTILKATLQKICAWLWKCYISLDIPKIVIYVAIIEFYKGVAQLGTR